MQDDLAEHTMHSPVWISYDPDYDIVDYNSDWEDSVDEYYDESNTATLKRKVGDLDGIHGVVKKRGKLEPTKQIPELVLSEGVRFREPVVWRARHERLKSPELPIFREGDAETVALLKDWRERSDAAATATASLFQPASKKQRTKTGKSNYTQNASVANGQSGTDDKEIPLRDDTISGTYLPPMSLTPNLTTIVREQHHPPDMNGTSSILKKQALQQASTTNHENLPQIRKRRVSNYSDEQDKEASRDSKRVKPMAKARGVTQNASKQDIIKGGEVNGRVTTRGKRKAEELGDENSVSPKKKQFPLGKEIKLPTTNSKVMERKTGRQTRSKKS